MRLRILAWPIVGIVTALLLANIPQMTRANSAPIFGGIPWGSSDSAIKRELDAKGFVFVKKDSDGDLDFKGQVNEQKVLVYELMTPSRHLVKSQVVFLTADDEAIQYFHDLQDTLIQKYGDPQKTFSFYQYPYNDDDPEAEHETAFQVGKATLSSFWIYSDGSSLWLEVTKRLTVVAHYESAGWHAELARRESSGNSVL